MDNDSRAWFRLIAVALAGSLIMPSACALAPEQAGDERSAQIYDPADGTHVALGAALEISSWVSSPGVVTAMTLHANGRPVRIDLFTYPYLRSGRVHQPWTPPAAGTYGLQVLMQDADGNVMSDVVTIIVEGGITPTVLTRTPFTPTLPTGTPFNLTTTITVTPWSGAPEATANQNTNCRAGPATAYPPVWDFLQGETAPIVGQNEGGTWVQVQPPGSLNKCWAWIDLVTVHGTLNDVPVAAAPALPITVTPTVTKSPKPPEPPKPEPEPSYTSCQDYPDLSTCSSDPEKIGGCYWDTGMNKCMP